MQGLTPARTLTGTVTCMVVMWWILLGMPLVAAQQPPAVPSTGNRLLHR